jgi:hypothetical protein
MREMSGAAKKERAEALTQQNRYLPFHLCAPGKSESFSQKQDRHAGFSDSVGAFKGWSWGSFLDRI